MLEVDKIYCGDCLEVMKDIDDKSIDMILCDLPYGTTDCSWDSVIDLNMLWINYKRIMKDNCAILLFGGEPFSSKLRFSCFEYYKYDWYWHKNRPSGQVYAKFQPMRSIENICVFYKDMPIYNPQMISRTEDEIKRLGVKSSFTVGSDVYSKKWGRTANRDDNKLKFPTNVLTFDTVHNNSYEKLPHPTQKPVDLFKYLIKTYTNEGDLVLDNCIGSGTTAVACRNTNRHYIGIDISEEYCKIARERVAKIPARLDSFIKFEEEALST